MEKMPTPENLENRVIKAFKEKGTDDPEAKALFLQWLQEQEAKVENDPLAAIEFNLKRARLYLKIGLREEALENFEDASRQAQYENRTELIETIEAEIDKNFNV